MFRYLRPASAFAVFLFATGCTPGNAPSGNTTVAADAAAEGRAAVSSATLAGVGKPMDEYSKQIIDAAGLMNAISVLCIPASKSEVDRGVVSLRGKLQAEGFDGNEFDRLYQASYGKTAEQMQSGAIGMREQRCAQIKKMLEDGFKKAPSSEDSSSPNDEVGELEPSVAED